MQTGSEDGVILAVPTLGHPPTSPSRTPTETLAFMFTPAALHPHMFHCLLSLSTLLTSACVTQIDPPGTHTHTVHTLAHSESWPVEQQQCWRAAESAGLQHHLERFMLPFSVADRPACSVPPCPSVLSRPPLVDPYPDEPCKQAVSTHLAGPRRRPPASQR